MDQRKEYTNYDDFQVLKLFFSFYTVKSSSDGWNRYRMHFSNSDIKFTFYLSTKSLAHEHRFLSNFN